MYVCFHESLASIFFEVLRLYNTNIWFPQEGIIFQVLTDILLGNSTTLGEKNHICKLVYTRWKNIIFVTFLSLWLKGLNLPTSINSLWDNDQAWGKMINVSKITHSIGQLCLRLTKKLVFNWFSSFKMSTSKINGVLLL